jgi:hypothetical protein
MIITETKNNWAKHHATLTDQEKIAARGKVIEACEWSQATFYRKLNNEDALKQWEKNLIASCYNVKVNKLFAAPLRKALPL